MKTDDRRGLDYKQRQTKKFPKQLTMEAKRFLIIEMVSKGKTYTEIVNYCIDNWGLGLKSCQHIVEECLDYMRSDEAKESLIAMNMQRLDDLYKESRGARDRKSAIKAIDVQNKMAGAYTEKVQIDGDSTIDLHFDM